jgi:hypothetical protein
MGTGDITGIILAILTGVYVLYTGRLNHHARNSADAAKKSATASETATAAALETAQASRRAAEAAERSAALSEATIPVDFSARLLTTGLRTIVMVRSETASVHVFSIYVRLLVVPETTGSIREVSGTTTVVNDEGQPVLFVHRGEEVLAVLADPLTPGDTVIGHATVRYGFLPEPAGRDRVIEIKNQKVTSAP